MSVKVKIILILAATLVLGVLLGALASGMIANQRQEKLQRTRTHEGFVNRMQRIIEPESEEQRRQIAEVLEDGVQRMFEVRRQHAAVIANLVDSLRAELQPILTEEQMSRLEQDFRRGQERMLFRHRDGGHRDGRHQEGRHREGRRGDGPAARPGNRQP